jgi:hypothetical protein
MNLASFPSHNFVTPFRRDISSTTQHGLSKMFSAPGLPLHE